MKPIKCKVLCNNRRGYAATPYEAEGVRWAKESGWVVVDGRVVRRGFGNNDRLEISSLQMSEKTL